MSQAALAMHAGHMGFLLLVLDFDTVRPGRARKLIGAGRNFSWPRGPVRSGNLPCMTSSVRWTRFSGPAPDLRLSWHAEPAHWSVQDACLRVEPDARTDFWQRTHYGFQADNGHFLFAPVTGDVVVTTHVRFHARHQYDQAGLMLRLSPSCWLKTSVEHEPGARGRLGAVVTNHGYSDWSTQPYSASEVWLRIRREGADCIVDASEDGRGWEQIRMAHLAEDDGTAGVTCGLYACSPKEAGFVAEFFRLDIAKGRVTPPAH
jgi:regulation of enolase protein 1 (concanavalin A-like superfamily)